ncbi:PhoB family transcriptional regulator [Salinisphaera orenii MK-B5]|uniref:Phosphate regulon transcriptional regulatory protein PhoB n=1 Tax=Salinisphaera orenii MK-B5 TaxID=856730 RepID=A0A423PT76_9GAMM|nr:response regulator transcription factor [Salinisphaera orenii]ROO28741.1 PhoB family transcriptional regulator [Salinisphaera orenii MK-B5]
MAERILCVEDDPDIGRLLVAILGEAGYPADWVTSGERALECWRDAALVVLDLMLPGIDGLAVCREIRGHDAGIPLIMLTALAGTRDVVLGLEIGADDYITKPFDAAILLARVQALLRRRQRESVSSAAGATSAPIVVGPLRVDIDKHEVRIDDVPVSLTAKEFALLALFARNPGHGFSRSDLLDQVWGPEFDGFDHTVNTHINRLRGKIEADPAAPRYIQTVWGVGYRFVDPHDTPGDA